MEWNHLYSILLVTAVVNIYTYYVLEIEVLS